MRADGVNDRSTDRTDVQKAAMLFGIIFLIVGVAGFIPGITTDYDRLTVFDDQGAKLLGIFGTNIIENIAHLLFGIAGLALARTWSGAKNYFIWGGLIYVALWLYGLIIEENSAANFMGLNNAANWLHLVLGIAMLAAGYLLSRRVVREGGSATAA
ncbi:MAG: DUF4383 domain-containing protein [Actinobacteria bacterium]|nr:DUF4383 domain-containing protein [Actinomycetota bacterium]